MPAWLSPRTSTGAGSALSRCRARQPPASIISADYRRRGGRQVTDDRMRVVVQQVLATVLAIPLAILIAFAIGLLLETTIFSRLYRRDHLYQVLLTFGLILIFEELRSIFFGDEVHGVAVPAIFTGPPSHTPSIVPSKSLPTGLSLLMSA